MDAKSAEKEKSEGQEPPATLEKENPPDASESAEQKQPPEEAEIATPAERDLFNYFRSQIEFYFGDANLSKDRFLQRCVDMDPYMAPEVLLTFNKIMTLTEDVQQIAKSLSNSQLLELDESGMKVKRKTTLPKQRDVNDKTLYVEALPANASHDWLKEVFSRYGPVAYVCLPHYPGTKKIKEFAFIEFEKAGSVEKAVKAFGQVHGVLSVETDPGELASVRSFQQQQQLEHQQQPKEEQAEPEDPATKSLKKEILDKGGHEAKRVKLEEAPPTESSTAEETASESEQDGKPEADKPNIEPSALELKVMPKTSWSSLHNKDTISEADTESEDGGNPGSDDHGVYGERLFTTKWDFWRMIKQDREAKVERNKKLSKPLAEYKFGDGHHKIPGPDID